MFCNICNEITDLKVHHAKNQRHDRIRDFNFSIASQGCLNASKEMKNLFEGQERPADVYISNYKEGKDYLFDTRLTCPTGFGLIMQLILLINYADPKENERHSYEPLKPPFSCFICSKTHTTRQGLEIHLIHSKKPCYVGLIPQGLDLYLSAHNRSFCGPCRKSTACRPAYILCNSSALLLFFQLVRTYSQ
jgi:hypothetical protein